jgi:putative GTP pyrophosphokinase
VAGKSNETAPFDLDRESITDKYTAEYHVYEALKQEAVFILQDRIASRSIKIHTIESRVKELESLLDKCARKRCNEPFEEFADIAAVRVICLFRSDLDRLKQLARDNFEVIEIDDKIETGQDPLSYQSIHIICKMRPGYTGPRYERIRNRIFEIQLRTLCMHCWAAVSHHVDYKGDWDVPANLKMALSALSGLFFVADNEFEQFYVARLASKESAENTSKATDGQVEINLDTVSALLARLYPKRDSGAATSMSEFVQELKEANYTSLAQLEADLEKGATNPIEYERLQKGGSIYFTVVGAARRALEEISPEFARVRKEANDEAPLSKRLPRKKGTTTS